MRMNFVFPCYTKSRLGSGVSKAKLGFDCDQGAAVFPIRFRCTVAPKVVESFLVNVFQSQGRETCGDYSIVVVSVTLPESQLKQHL